MTFPDDFHWGVATAAFQIEGTTHEDGRGTSIWDTFCATPGNVANGDTGEVACDHYHRYHEDIAIMRELGIRDYRMSMAWPRLFPDGDSRRNAKGFDFYDRVIDGLLEAGIEPNVTLYHWDLPQPLEDAGGWPTRVVLEPFAEYAAAVGTHFGDRVKRFAPLNEPAVFTYLGYGNGVHAPGRADEALSFAAAHHTVVAHNLATRALRETVSGAMIGPVLSQSSIDVDDVTDPAQLVAAERMDAFSYRFWMDGILLGRYPELVVQSMAAELDRLVKPGDLDVLPVDWVGVNFYFNERIGARDPDGSMAREPYGSRTDMGWPITPHGLGALLTKWHRIYGDLIPELYVTENGCAYDDGPGPDGRVHDERRIAYLRDHLDSVSQAIAAGAPVKGYYQWSLLDNFEWAAGYGERFGLVHVDYGTQRRTIKDSARWYADVIRRNGL
jgi:beta-glucosidase